MDSLWSWLEATAVARAVGGSLLLTASLSALHVVGMTLVTGAAFVLSLRLLGVLFAEQPAAELTWAARRGLLIGLAVSVSTGLALFSTRATAAVENEFFQLKILLLGTAVALQFGVSHRMLVSGRPAGPGQRVAGALALLLWIGVAGAGAAYILLE